MIKKKLSQIQMGAKSQKTNQINETAVPMFGLALLLNVRWLRKSFLASK